MPKRSESLLEKLKLGQQGWNEVLSRNAQRLNDILLKVDGLLDVDITNLATGDVLWWNASNQKFENVNKAYAVSAGSVSSWSSESSIMSVSSESSESSESSNASPSSDSSDSSSSNQATCGDWGADLTTAETATASDDYNNPTWAIDGDTTHGWASDEILPEWWKIELSSPANVERLRIYPYVNVDQHPTAFTFQGSNSGDFTGEQDTLLTVSGYVWTSGVWGDWEFVNGQNYRYYRIYITATNDASYTRLNEIQMYQCDARSGSSSSESNSSESSFSSHSSLSSESSWSDDGITNVTFDMIANADDGGGVDDGSGWNNTGVSLNFGNVSGSGYWNYFRYQNITIPAGSTILSAKLNFYAHTTKTGTTCNVNIYFEDEETTTVPTSGADMISRSLGTPVAWSGIGSWTWPTRYDSPDLTEELQAIIDKVGWASGNAITIHIKDNGSTSNAYRNTSTRNASTANAADLIIQYMAP